MATIIGTIVRPDGSAFVGDILFRPLSTPLMDSPDLITTKDVISTTSGSGNLSVVLRAGRYSVVVPDSKPFRISVPDDSNTYTLLSRIYDDLNVVCSDIPGALPSVATTTTLGMVYVDTDDPAPVAVLGWFVFETLAAMKAKVTTIAHKIAVLVGNAAAGDQPAKMYRWWAASTATADDDNIIQPTDVTGAGRWIIFMG